MLSWLLRRLLATAPVILIVLFAAFALALATPENAATLLAGENVTLERMAEIRAQLHLDDPLIERFGSYMVGLAHGDLGASWFSGQPVAKSLGEAIPVTLSLLFMTMSLALAVSLPAGVFVALRPGSPSDRFVTAAAALGTATPAFVLAFLLVITFAIQFRLLPAIGYTPMETGLWNWLQHLFLPGVALAATVAADMVRQVRGSLIDVLGRDFIRAKLAAGVPWPVIVVRHGLKHAAIPIITVLGLEIGRVLSSVVIVESVFSMPGLGALTYQAALRGDLPVLQGVVLVIGALVLVTNLLVDLSYGYFNPRLRYG